MLANRDILEPVVEQTRDLVREEEFANLVKELGFLRATTDEDNVESSTPAKVKKIIKIAIFRGFVSVYNQPCHKQIGPFFTRRSHKSSAL